MNWKPLKTEQEIDNLIKNSFVKAQLIFKYSSRCSLSDDVRDKLEMESTPSDIDFYFLDLIAFRKISNLVAEKFNIRHQSPQVLLIRNGECVYNESHWRITMDEIASHAPAA